MSKDPLGAGKDGASAQSLKIDRSETIDTTGIEKAFAVIPL